MEEPNTRDQDEWAHYQVPTDATENEALQEDEASVEPAAQVWNHREGAQPDAVDIMRTSVVIIVGALAGVVLVLLALLLLRPQGAASQPNSSKGGSLTAATTSNSSEVSQAGEQSTALPPAPVVGRYAPDFTLKTLDGESVTLSVLRGRPVWINFWATWCPPCRAEMPEMKQKYAKFKEKGLVILGVDVGEETGGVREFVTMGGFDWTFALDNTTEVSRQYFVGGIPVHLFVGKDGIIKAIQAGGLPGNMMDRYVAMIVDQ